MPFMQLGKRSWITWCRSSGAIQWPSWPCTPSLQLGMASRRLGVTTKVRLSTRATSEGSVRANQLFSNTFTESIQRMRFSYSTSTLATDFTPKTASYWTHRNHHYQLSILGKASSIPCSCIIRISDSFSASVPSQTCTWLGWHNLTHSSTKPRTWRTINNGEVTEFVWLSNNTIILVITLLGKVVNCGLAATAKDRLKDVASEGPRPRNCEPTKPDLCRW